jgi:hypothetical protein
MYERLYVTRRFNGPTFVQNHRSYKTPIRTTVRGFNLLGTEKHPHDTRTAVGIPIGTLIVPCAIDETRFVPCELTAGRILGNTLS